MSVKPITPKDVAEKKSEIIPDGVIEAFNELIAKNFRGGTAVIKQNEIVKLIRAKVGGVSSNQVFENNWLDVEAIYEKAGWIVEYDKPGYCENYEANFTFIRKV